MTKFIISILYVFLLNMTFAQNIFGDTRQDSTNNERESYDMYLKMRDLAFSITPDKLHLNMKEMENQIYGTLIEFKLESAFVTIAAFISGDASIYFSSGGGFIGGFAYDTIKNSAIRLNRIANEYLCDAKLTTNFDIPKDEEVKFYFLTSQGIYLIEDDRKKINRFRSKYSSLFVIGNDIITGYRINTSNID
ncbi:MAG TPA: hypothetical protein VHP30_02930 [Ignavibacteriales bacterium]|nr:hypothetical protein [Ignavibacteriales bacterium]